jgi:folate-binding protein YgfZ
MNQDLLDAYGAAYQSAAFYRIRDAGCLRISGEDRIDFLQRQTTNDLRILKTGIGLLSVLTSPNARILDVLYVYQDESRTAGAMAAERAIIAVTLPGRARLTEKFLQSRIFFMDKVSVQRLDDQHVQYELLGPEAEEVIKSLGAGHAPHGDELLALPVEGCTIRIFKTRGTIGLGYRLIVPASLTGDYSTTLKEAGAEELQVENFQLLLVENGVPGADYELTEAYTPLEVRITTAVAENKGCYTGQEVITRQITYDKVNRHLAGVRFEGQVVPGQRLLAEGKVVGTVGSVVLSPLFDWIGLAVIKRPHHLPGVSLQVESPGPDTGSNLVGGIVTPLPFE